MKTTFIVSALLSLAQAEGAQPTTNSATTQLNSADMTKQIMDSLQPTIQASIDSAVQKQLEQAGKTNQNDFDKLMVYQKLESVLNDFENVDNLKQLWKDVSSEDKTQYLNKINFEFDLTNGQIHATSGAVDTEGKPVYDWNLHQGKGEITETVRVPETSASVVTPAAEVVVAQPVQNTVTEEKAPETVPTTFEGIDWESMDMEQQREIAFKIVYFFIAFVMMTFGLLFLYYKLDQKEQAKEERTKRAKGIFYGDVNQKTFFDFLAGQVDDENYLVNPHARISANRSKSFVSSQDKSSEDQTDIAPSLKASSIYYQQ